MNELINNFDASNRRNIQYLQPTKFFVYGDDKKYVLCQLENKGKQILMLITKKKKRNIISMD